MYSFSKIPLNAEIVQAVVTDHFGSANLINTFEELKEGFFNAAALFTLADGSAWVLKAAPPDEVQGLRYEKNIMKAEVESMRLVRARTSVPVPEIVVYDTSRRVLTSDYFIMKCLPGIPFHKIRKDIPAENQAEIERNLGRMAREMSEITHDAFGYWSQPQPVGVAWRECFTQMVRWVLQDGQAIDVKLPIPYDAMYQRIAAHFDALDEVTTARLVHWDLWDGNVFIDPSTYQISGLIDFERVMWADPLMEAFFGDASPSSHYAEGFGGGVFSTHNQVRRRWLYNAYLFLIMIIETYYRRYDNDWQIHWATDRMNELLKVL